MKIASILENHKIEKRVAITPEIAKKYISLGLEVSLSENYGSHLGIKNEDEVLAYYDVFVILPWHFKNFFVKNPKFKGKKLIFPLPTPELITP